MNEKVKNGQIKDWKVVEKDGDEIQRSLLPFLITKNYVKKDRQYLVICNFGLSFIFTNNNK